MTEFAEFVKTSPPAPGFSEVYYPGEIEYRTELQRRENGIFIEDETWRQISELMAEVGVPTEAVGQPYGPLRSRCPTVGLAWSCRCWLVCWEV